MSGCRAFRDELAEAALGAAASDALSSHVKGCAACGAELERQRALARRMTVPVDMLVRAEPPYRLVESIAARARLAHRSQTVLGTWRWAAVGAALVAAVIGLAFGMRALQPPVARGADVAALTAWRSPTGVLLERRGSVLDAPLAPVTLTTNPRSARK